MEIPAQITFVCTFYTTFKIHLYVFRVSAVEK